MLQHLPILCHTVFRCVYSAAEAWSLITTALAHLSDRISHFVPCVTAHHLLIRASPWRATQLSLGLLYLLATDIMDMQQLCLIEKCNTHEEQITNTTGMAVFYLSMLIYFSSLLFFTPILYYN
jgi:hypothetical protein